MDSLKYFIDIIQLLINLDIDFERLLEDAKRHKTKKESSERYRLYMFSKRVSYYIPPLFNKRNSTINKLCRLH